MIPGRTGIHGGFVHAGNDDLRKVEIETPRMLGCRRQEVSFRFGGGRHLAPSVP